MMYEVPLALNSELPGMCPGVLTRLERVRVRETHRQSSLAVRELSDALCKYTSWSSALNESLAYR
jgi:hypothetical protein